MRNATHTYVKNGLGHTAYSGINFFTLFKLHNSNLIIVFLFLLYENSKFTLIKIISKFLVVKVKGYYITEWEDFKKKTDVQSAIWNRFSLPSMPSWHKIQDGGTPAFVKLQWADSWAEPEIQWKTALLFNCFQPPKNNFGVVYKLY